MSFIATAIGAGSAIGGAIIGSSGSSSAAKTQSESADKANELQKQMYEQNRSDLGPWRTTGASALDELWSYLKPGGEMTKGYASFEAPTAITEQNDPGYQARLAEGQKSVERSAAARTGTLGGAATKAMSRYGQDYASNEFSNVYNRALNTYSANANNYNTNQNNLYNRLETLAGVGENAAGQTANLGQAAASQIGQNVMGAGNANAASQISNANLWGSAINGTTGNIQNMLMLQQMLNQSGYQKT
jgi:hypothetical protein